MNSPRTFSQSILALLLLVLATGCDFQEASDAFDQIDVILTLEDINTVVVGTVVDATTGNFVRRDVRLTFGGDNAGDLIDIYSDPVGGRTIDDGVTAFGVANSVVPSDANPVSFRVIANKEGYETGVANVVINEEGQHEFRIRLVPQNRTVAGTTRQTGASQTSGSGASTSTVNVTTPQTADAQTTASVTVPSGTQATTASGQPLTGTVTTNVNYFPPTSDSALQAFPGGMTDVTVTGGSGGSKTGSMIMAGLVNVSMTDASGNKAAQISQPINLTMDVPGEFVEAGLTTFDLFRLNATSGEWEVIEEGLTVADTDPSGKAGARIFGLSATTAAIVGGAVVAGAVIVEDQNDDNDYCTMTLAVNRNGNQGALRATLSGFGFSTTRTIPAGANSVRVEPVPSVPVGNYTVRVENGAGASDSASITGTCNGGSGANQTINVSLPTPISTTTDFTLKASADCGAINFKGQIPGFSAYVKPEGAADDQAVLIPKDDITFNRTPNNLRIQDVDAVIRDVRPGTVLEFFAILDSEREDFNERITVPSSNTTITATFDVDDDLCSSN